MFGLCRSLAILAALLLQTASLFAAPPGSCVGKFVGEWSHSAGTTTIRADGKMIPHCEPCVKVQTWTCDGNTITFSNDNAAPGQFTGTMTDINHIQGSTWTATRIGGAPRPTSPAKSNACPNDAMTYIRVISKGRGGAYVLWNSCAERKINVSFTTTDVYPLCTSTNQSDVIGAGEKVQTYSYCGKPPQVTSATFSAAAAR